MYSAPLPLTQVKFAAQLDALESNTHDTRIFNIFIDHSHDGFRIRGRPE